MPTGTSNAQHSAKTAEHYTPPFIVDAARLTLGSIDLDPASCEEANVVVKASRYMTKEINGLVWDWHGNVFLNPPGGREFPPDASHRFGSGRPNSQLWWPKLMKEYQEHRVPQAIFVGFSIEILQSAQNSGRPGPLSFPFCITRSRVIIFLPPDKGYVEAVRAFVENFGDIGQVVIPR